jgi:hypothetical protein
VQPLPAIADAIESLLLSHVQVPDAPSFSRLAVAHERRVGRVSFFDQEAFDTGASGIEVASFQ